MISLLFLLGKALLTIFSIITTLIIAFYVVLPLIRMRSYKRPDSTSYFFPLVGAYKYMMDDLKYKDDILARIKDFRKTNPDKRFEVTNLATNAVLRIRDHELIKEFLQKPFNYKKHHILTVLVPLAGQSLGLTEADVWKRRRRVISTAFHFEFLKENTKLIQQTVREFLDKISPADYNNVDIIVRLQQITSEIMGRVFFGDSLNQYTFEGKPLIRALSQLSEELGTQARTPLILIFGPKILSSPFVPKYRKLQQRIKKFRKLCFDIVQDRKKTKPTKTNDLLGALLATQRSNDPEEVLTDGDIVDDFVGFTFAGMDTTAYVTSMVLYYLLKVPRYFKELQEERDRTYNTEKIATIDTLHKMDALHAVIKESLRAFSAAIPDRVAICDHKLGDIDIKKGDVITADFVAVSYNEKLYKDPYEFNPDRFRDPNNKLDSFVFVPFSAGPRNCIGQHLALIEMKLIVSEFLERFEYKTKDDYVHRLAVKIMYGPANKLLFEVTPRMKTN